MVFGKKALVYATKTITYGVRFQVIWRWCIFINKAVWFLTSIKKYCFFSPKHYIQRRLIKGMEDLKVEYDMTVRNGKQRIIQFAYGDDGIDTIKVENQSLPLVAMSMDEIYAHFHMPLDNSSETQESAATAFTKTAYAKMKKEKTATMQRKSETSLII